MCEPLDQVFLLKRKFGDKLQHEHENFASAAPYIFKVHGDSVMWFRYIDMFSQDALNIWK